MKIGRRDFLAAAAAGGAGLALSQAALAEEARARMWAAIEYLRQPSSFTPWVFSAALANDVDCRHNENELAAINPIEPSNWAMLVLAARALGADPFDLGGRDLIAGLEAALAGSTAINADAWGIIALRAEGMPRSHPLIIACRDRILASQNDVLGWGSNPAQPNSNDTAAVLIALSDLGLTSSSPIIQRGITALMSYQNSGGGFSLDMAGEPDSCSDAWAMAAFHRLGIDPASFYGKLTGLTVIDHLVSLQAEDGSFNFRAGELGNSVFRAVATAYSLVALAGQYWPSYQGVQPPPDPIQAPMPLGSNSVAFGLGLAGAIALWRERRMDKKN